MAFDLSRDGETMDMSTISNENQTVNDAEMHQQEVDIPANVGGDPWANNVTITDQNSPIVVLFGPSSCGKTMTLVRLTRYLESKYLLSPDRAFRDSSDASHAIATAKFNEAVSNDEAAAGTAYVEYMLLRVQDKYHSRKTICQFVESPGEYLFALDEEHVKLGWRSKFPAYMNTISNSANRKIWVFFLDPSLSNSQKREYVNRIKSLTFDTKDRFVFLVNKIDVEATKHCMNGKTKIYDNTLRSYVDQYFPGLTSDPVFLKSGFWGVKELFKIVGFMTGTYTEGTDTNGRKYKTFQAGDDSHPKRLWDTIKDAIDRNW